MLNDFIRILQKVDNNVDCGVNSLGSMFYMYIMAIWRNIFRIVELLEF